MSKNSKLIQLATHYAHSELGITSEPFTKEKQKQLAKIRKIERNFGKPKYSDYSLDSFSIPLEELPEKDIALMKAIGWLSHYLAIPNGRQKRFLSETWNPDNQLSAGTALKRYFISIDAYIELLNIEHSIKGWVTSYEWEGSNNAVSCGESAESEFGNLRLDYWEVK